MLFSFASCSGSAGGSKDEPEKETKVVQNLILGKTYSVKKVYGADANGLSPSSIYVYSYTFSSATSCSFNVVQASGGKKTNQSLNCTYTSNDDDYSIEISNGLIGTVAEDGSQITIETKTPDDETIELVYTKGTITLTENEISSTKPAVTITFNANDGSENPAVKTQVISADTYSTLDANTFTREGYSFVGWAISKTAAGASYTNGYTSFKTNEDVTLYAVWKDTQNYFITFDPNGGSGEMPAQKVSKDSATAKLNANTYTKEGYVFYGWYSLKTTSDYIEYIDEGTISLDGNKTLYAVWLSTTAAAKVTFNANDGSASPATKIQYLSKNSSYDNELTPNIFTRENYTFKGWAKTADATTAKYKDKETRVSISVDTILYAVWEYSGSCTINFDANGGTGTMAAQTVTSGTASALNANAFTRSGYVFIGWAKTAAATDYDYADGYSSFMIQAPAITLYAVWKQDITVSLDPNYGSEQAQTLTASYIVAESKYKFDFPATVPERTGYEFGGWSTSSTATQGTYSQGGSVYITEAATFYAVWIKKLSVCVSVTVPSVSVVTDDVSITYDDTNKTLTAQFLTWQDFVWVIDGVPVEEYAGPTLNAYIIDEGIHTVTAICMGTYTDTSQNLVRSATCVVNVYIQ